MGWVELFAVPLICVVLGAVAGFLASTRSEDRAKWRVRGPMLGAGAGWFVGLALTVPLRAVGVLPAPPCTGVLDRELVERIGGETSIGELSAASQQLCEISVAGDEARHTLAFHRGEGAWTAAVAELEAGRLTVGSEDGGPAEPRVYVDSNGLPKTVFGSTGGTAAILDGPELSEEARASVAERLQTVVFPALEI